MDKIPCPICSRLNNPQDTHCWHCQAALHPTPSEPGGMNVDWLTGLGNSQELTSNEPVGNQKDAPLNNSTEEFVPDWLARIRAREAAEREEKKTKEDEYWAKKQPNDGTPDWLRSLSGEEETPVSSDQPNQIIPDVPDSTAPENPPNSEEIPTSGTEDWIESLKTLAPEEDQSQPATDNEFTTPVREGEIKNQEESAFIEPLNGQESAGFDLDRLFEQPEEPQKPAFADEISNEPLPEILPEGSDSPDLISPLPLDLSERTQDPFEGQKQENLESVFLPNSLVEENLFTDKESVTPIDFEPQVISTDEVQNEDQFPILIPEELHVSIPKEEIGSTQNTTDIENIPTQSFTPDDLPEWLTNVQEGEKPTKQVKPTESNPVDESDSKKLEKGNLPVWLEALRPVEAVALSPTKRDESQTAGTNEVNVGVKGALTGISPATLVIKPSDLSGGLRINNRQKTNAALLAAIAVNAEDKDAAEAEVAGKQVNLLWRALLAVVFIVIIILGGTTLKDYGLQPALFPEEVVHTFDQINSIPVDKPVLIAGEFEAGFAGEIRLSSQSLIEHLMRRNLNIALISTNPVDTALLFDQINQGLQSVSTYSVSEKVVDLGYLPGNSIAIQGLSNSFMDAVPLTAQLTPTKTHPILSRIQNLQDFGAIIVITDKSETARVWIEQARPELGNTPLLLVTSAQASPLIQPYYQSGQINGLVSGMPGSLVYERILGINGEATGNIASLQMISIFMAGLILVGGFICLVKPVTNEGKVK